MNMPVEPAFDFKEFLRLHGKTTPHTARSWIKKGWLVPSFRIGDKMYFTEERVREFRFSMNQRSQKNLENRHIRLRAEKEIK